jgi:5'-phosphate synthase pdxT subunit
MGYQGGSELHLHALSVLAIPARKVLQQKDFDGLSGLILPGGESSVQYQYCQREGLEQAIRAFARSGKPILGTCAGAILLSTYSSPKVKGFGLIDLNITRNTYGPQIASGLKYSDKGNSVLFIRAPGIGACGPKVEILDSYNGAAIFVKQDNCYACTFHPEAFNLDQDNILNKLFRTYNHEDKYGRRSFN